MSESPQYPIPDQQEPLPPLRDEAGFAEVIEDVPAELLSSINAYVSDPKANLNRMLGTLDCIHEIPLEDHDFNTLCVKLLEHIVSEPDLLEDWTSEQLQYGLKKIGPRAAKGGMKDQPTILCVSKDGLPVQCLLGRIASLATPFENILNPLFIRGDKKMTAAFEKQFNEAKAKQVAEELEMYHRSRLPTVPGNNVGRAVDKYTKAFRERLGL